VGVFLIYNTTIDDLLKTYKKEILKLKTAGLEIYLIALPSAGKIDKIISVNDVEV
jgi:hypothetical protein